jgi:hypothetical protein
MTTQTVQELHKRLERDKALVLKTFTKVQSGGWGKNVYTEPYPWTLRDLLVHFVSAERAMWRHLPWILALKDLQH